MEEILKSLKLEPYDDLSIDELDWELKADKKED